MCGPTRSNTDHPGRLGVFLSSERARPWHLYPNVRLPQRTRNTTNLFLPKSIEKYLSCKHSAKNSGLAIDASSVRRSLIILTSPKDRRHLGGNLKGLNFRLKSSCPDSLIEPQLRKIVPASQIDDVWVPTHQQHIISTQASNVTQQTKRHVLPSTGNGCPKVEKRKRSRKKKLDAISTRLELGRWLNEGGYSSRGIRSANAVWLYQSVNHLPTAPSVVWFDLAVRNLAHKPPPLLEVSQTPEPGLGLIGRIFAHSNRHPSGTAAFRPVGQRCTTSAALRTTLAAAFQVPSQISITENFQNSPSRFSFGPATQPINFMRPRIISGAISSACCIVAGHDLSDQLLRSDHFRLRASRTKVCCCFLRHCSFPLLRSPFLRNFRGLLEVSTALIRTQSWDQQSGNTRGLKKKKGRPS